MTLRSSERLWLSWSSGKDSAWTLHLLRRSKEYAVAALVTTFNREAGRVAMHGVRQELAEVQAREAGLPLIAVPLPSPCSNEAYEAAMQEVMARAVREGVASMAFGDLFLEDIRRYREMQLRGGGVTAVFPLWGRDTATLAREMIGGGLRAVVTCVDPKRLPACFAGREYDQRFLDDLPADVDPCGERGEFHTFAYDGPMFAKPVAVSLGEVVTREGFVFADVRPGITL